MRVWSLAASVVAILAVVGSVAAQDKKDDKKPAGPIVLKVVSKKDKYVFGGLGKTPEEYKAYLDDIAKKQANGERVSPPNPLRVDLVLQFENTSREAVTIYVGGDASEYTFELTGGAGIVELFNPSWMTLEQRISTGETIEPGKTHEIPVKMLADGSRGISRFLYWTG